ncbi:MAG: hypothetical protein IKK63_02260 [Clostridia bacterium]|nr:hypothetical protein [Clostridia bacterium]MBR3819672.1 hypothetical protein [Clostridia bacterium]
MEKKKFYKTSEFWCFFITIAEFILFVVWGLNMHGGDEMGYSLIAFYGAVPITALILCAVLAAKKSKLALPLAAFIILIEFFLPFIVFETFEFELSLALAGIPCIAGLVFGYILSKRK